jgi:para-nitrobenzyl esterase
MSTRKGGMRAVAGWLCLMHGLLVNSAASADPASDAPQVMTSDGLVVGSRRDHTDAFLGIPYAAAPIDELRWKPPTAPPRWSAPLDATRFRSWCLQVAPEGFSKPIVNEDCLYLNVFAPRGASSSEKKRAVMVWLHGGGLRQGRADDYDPTPLVERGDVIFVSLNYRLNILGFLAHPELDREGHDFANYGLMDQRYALAWVQRNIASFGGDPGNVTLIGESSGGANVFNQIALAHSTGLFHKAIIQSGSLWYGPFAPFYDGLPLGEAQDVGRKVASMTGCAGPGELACLRALPASRLADVVRELPSYAFGVVVDGSLLDRPMTQKILAGDFNRIPVLNGSNHDEWTWVEGLSERAAGRPLVAGDLPKHLEGAFGGFAADVVPQYPVVRFAGSAGAASARAVTDGLFVCPLLGLNSALSKYTTVWGFEFADEQAPFPWPAASLRYGAAHTLELQYLFRNFTGAVGETKPLSPAQARLSDAMVAYWTNFAKHGNPNAKGLPEWPALADAKQIYLSLVTPEPVRTRAATIDSEHRCDVFWRRTVGVSPLKPAR